MPKILLLEDDFLIAFDMKTQLEDAGMEVVGPVASNVRTRRTFGTVPQIFD